MLTEIQHYTNACGAIPGSLTYIPIRKQYLFIYGARFGFYTTDGNFSLSGQIPSGLSISNIGYGKDATGNPQIYAMVYVGTTYYLYKVVTSSLTLNTSYLATYTGVRFVTNQSFWVDETNNVMYGASSPNGGAIAKFNMTTGAVITTYPTLPLLPSATYDNFILDISDFDTFKAYQYSSTKKIFEGKLSTSTTTTYTQSTTLAALAWNSDLGVYRQVDTYSPCVLRDYKPIQAVASIVATKNDISQQNSGFVLSIAARDADNAPVANAPIRTRVYGLEATKTITSITRVGTTATATCTAHGYVNNDVVYIPAVGQYLDQPSWGVNQVEYSGFFAISNVTANTFDFTVSGTPVTPATGTNIIAARTVAPFGSISVAPISEAGKIFSNLAINVSPTTDITMTTDANGQITLTYVNSTTSTGTDVFRFDSL